MTDNTPAKSRNHKTIWISALLLGSTAIGLYIWSAQTKSSDQSANIAAENPQEKLYLERGAKRKNVLSLSESAPALLDGKQDRWTYTLQPFESIELKYNIAEAGKIIFQWNASQPLYVDMHAHPFDGGEELTESYSIGSKAEMAGTYQAAFSGVHGWHWQNRNLTSVELELTASGQIDGSTQLDGRGEHERALTNPSASPTAVS